MSKVWTTVVAGMVTFGLVACGADDPPELPPEDTMALPTFDGSDPNAQSQNTGNVALAALSVGAVTFGVQAVLLVPRAFLAGVLTAEAEADGDDWVWSQDFPLLGVNGSLRATGEEGSLDLSMTVDGLREGIELEQFEWFTGSHRLTEGNWTLYDPAVASGPVLSIDWERTSATEKSLVFTNVTSGVPEAGDTITYEQSGTSATMTVVDQVDGQGGTTTLSVAWDLEDGSGRFTVDANTLCWDTLEDGQVDIPCP